jgi:hypothetical protein
LAVLNCKERICAQKYIRSCTSDFLPLLFAQQALNNDAVIKLVKAGFSDDLIVATIHGVAGTYDISADELIALKAGGASEKVVAAIVAKASASPAAVAPAPAPAPAAPAAADPDDPDSPHDPGLYLRFIGPGGKLKMARLDQRESNTTPSAYSVSIKARIPGPRAALRTFELRPTFFLYFPSTNSMTDAADPSQFTLLTLDGKKDHRETEIGRLKGFAGAGVIVTELDKDSVIHCSS